MIAENMNTTTSFVIVVLVATHGIIGNETTLDTIEEQTNDSLGLTTESISKNEDVQISTTYSEDSTINTTEQATTIIDNTSTELRNAKRDSYEETTEDFAATTEQGRIAPNNDSTEYLKTSVTHKTTHEHQAPTVNVKEQSLKQASKENATELNKHTRISDENIISTTETNESVRAPLKKLDNTTEQLPIRSIEIDRDEKDNNTSEHEALMDLFKSDEGEIEITTNARRRLNFEPELLESRTGRNNMETATVARTNSLTRPHHFSNFQQNNPKPYGNRPQYSTPLTPFNSLEINTLPPFPRYTTQQPNFYQSPRPHPNSMEHGLLSLMSPHDQFENRQQITAPLSMQTLRPPSQFWPPLIPVETLQPLSPSQSHQQLSSQIPDRRMSTIPTRTNMDNIFESLQRASLHPVLSTKQYTDFYQKNWNRNMFK